MTGTRPALQARSRKSRDAILDALEQMLKQRPFHEIGVVELARAAGLSPASIYRRFEKKDGLIPALFELQLERSREWYQQHDIQSAFAALGGLDLRPFLEGNVRLLLRQLRDLAHLGRPMSIYGRMRPDLLSETVSVMTRSAIEQIERQLAVFEGEILRGDPKLVAQMVAYTLQVYALDYVLFRDDTVLPDYPMTDEMFAQEMAAMLYGYLRTPR